VAGVVGFFVVTLGVYLAISSAGNPIDILRLAIRNVSPSQIKAAQDFANLGYLGWVWSVFGGGLGSLYGVPVGANQWSWTIVTLELALPAVAVGGIAGWVVGTLSSRRAGYFLRVLSLALLSLPAFWIGELLLYQFSFALPALPSYGAASPYPPYWGGSQFADQLAHLVLPLTTFAITSFAMFSIWVGRTSMKYKSVPFGSALKASFRETLGFSGLALALLLCMTVGVETAFSWPGLGYATARAVEMLDFVTLSATWTILGIVALVAVVLSALVYALTRPREVSEIAPEPSSPGRISFKAEVAVALVGITLLLAVWGGLFAPYPARSLQCFYQGCANLPPFTSAAHPFGTERSGIDVFSDTLHGLANDLAAAVAISVVALVFGMVLRLVSSRLSGVIRWVVYLAVAANVPLWAMWLERTSAFVGAASAQSGFPGIVLGLGLLGGLVVSLLGKEKQSQGGFRGLVTQAVPGTMFVAGFSLLLLEYLGFLGFSPLGSVSIGLVISEGFVSLVSSPWVWFFPGLVGSFAVFSLFLLADSLS